MIVDREKNHCVNISILEFLSLGGNSLFFHRSSLWFTNAKLMCSTTQSVEQFLGFSALIFLHLEFQSYIAPHGHQLDHTQNSMRWQIVMAGTLEKY